MTDVELHINLLGLVEVMRNGHPVELPPSRKARALLFYLVATAQSHTRQHLCDLLWDGPADPRASLRWGLSQIRPVVDDQKMKRIVSERNKVWFRPENVHVDYYFLTKLRENDLSEVPDRQLKKAVDLCKGPFLDDCEVAGCYRFETWLSAQREEVKKLQFKLFSVWINRLKAQPEEAAFYARKMLLLDPYNEQIYIRLVELLGEAGQTSEALQLYNQCRNMVREELHATPSAALESARRKLLQFPEIPLSQKKDAKGQEFPLVGRQKELELIDQVIAQAEQHTLKDLLLFTGEPGIGKTRLLLELKDQVSKNGGSSLSGRAYSLEMSRPYTPWSDLLRSIRESMLPASIQKGIAPLLAGSTTPATGDGDQNRLYNAVLEWVRLMGADGKPLAILFDNLQWFDEPSLALLNFLSREVSGSNIVVACTARPVELQENKTATQFIHWIQRENRLREVLLSPLTLPDIQSLTDAIDTDLDSERIYRVSSGNPLFAMEVAYALAEDDEILPDSLMSLIQERMNLLDDRAKTVLNWAAVCEHDINLNILSECLEYSTLQILDAVETLESYNFIRAEPGEHYNFVHELVQHAAYRLISEPRRKMIHGRIAEIMAGNENIIQERAVEIIYHGKKGGDDELVVRACLMAGQRSLELYAYKQADEFARKGLTHLDGLSDEKGIPLRIELLRLYLHAGMIPLKPPSLIEQLRDCVGEARQAGLNAMVQKALDGISHYHYLEGDYHTALERMIKAEEAGRASDSITMVKAIADTAKCYGMLDRNMDRAEELAMEAKNLAVELDLENRIYDIPLALAYVHHNKGEYQKAAEQYQTALRIIRMEETDRWWEYLALHRLLMLHLEQGRMDEALELSRELIPITRKMGSGSEEPFSQALKVLTQFLMNEQEAAEKLDQYLQVLRELDSQWMVAWLQSCAAAQDLECGRRVSARRRAEEAVDAASAVDRRSEKALAISVLIRLLVREGKYNEAKALLESIKAESANTHLSFYARQNLIKATQSLA